MEKVSTIPFQELDIKELENYMELYEAYTQKRSSEEEAVRKMKQEIKEISVLQLLGLL